MAGRDNKKADRRLPVSMCMMTMARIIFINVGVSHDIITLGLMKPPQRALEHHYTTPRGYASNQG